MSFWHRLSNLWRPPQRWGTDFFYPVSLPASRRLDYLQAFDCIPEVNAVISLKARAFSNARLKIVDRNGKEISHRYLSLLEKPNWFQAQKEFIRQTKTLREIFGNEFIYKLQPAGMDRSVKALFTLPPNLVTCEFTDGQPFFAFDRMPAIEYSAQMNGRKIPLGSENVIHMNDNRVMIDGVNDKSILLGESKLKSLEQVIANLFACYESRGVILRHRGAQGIVSNDNKDALGSQLPLLPNERDEMENHFKQRYGTLSHQHNILLTSSAVKWQAIEIRPDKLGLYQEAQEGFHKVLDTFGVPADLFTSAKGSTYENQRQALKGFYLDTIIPEANEWVGELNHRLMTDEPGKIIADFSHLPIFEEDLKAKADAINATVDYLARLFQDAIITREEYRSEIQRIGIGRKASKSEKQETARNGTRINGHHFAEV